MWEIYGAGWEGQTEHPSFSGKGSSCMATKGQRWPPALLTGGEALPGSGVLSETLKFSLAAGKAAAFSSFILAAGRKTQVCFCISNDQHSARVSCAQGCSWCPRLGQGSRVLVISGLPRDWGLPGLPVGRWDLLLSVFVRCLMGAGECVRLGSGF